MPANSPRSKTRGPRKPPGQQPRFNFPINEVRNGRESIIAGIIGTIIIHLLVILLVPKFIALVEVDAPPSTGETPRSMDLELSEAQPVAAPNKNDPRYVETNPEAPDKTPDKTDAISARNQVAANVDEAKELSPDETPARKGEEKAPFDRAFAGDPNPPVEVQPTPPPAPEMEQQVASEDQSRKREAPPTGSGEEKPATGAGSAPGAVTPTPEVVQGKEKVEGTEAGSETGPQTASTLTTPARPQPAPRPRILQSNPGIVTNQAAGVSQTGYVGVNARFSQYGAYMERMVEAVTQRWHKMCADNHHSETSTRVELEFTITREGTIKNLSTVDTNAQALGILLCRTAVLPREGESYGLWTKDMVAVLGEEQTIRFTFYYW